MNFLYLLYFVGVVIACFQDIKRREVDDWLNLLLYFSGTAFLIFSSGVENFSIGSYGFFTFFMALTSFFLYNSRFFAGGDAKLVFALTPIFYETLFAKSLENLAAFLFFLVLSGAVYGLFFIVYISIKDFKKLRAEFVANFRENKLVKYLFVLVLVFIFLSYFEFSFFIIGLSLLIINLIFILTKSLEKVSFTVEKNYSDLQEGDWLKENLRIGGKVIRVSWDGLSEQDINFIKKYRKKVWIKEGIPYAPAFFIALILYFFREAIINIIF